MAQYGIDVSYAQGSIEWERAYQSYQFYIVRAGYGQNNIDATADYNCASLEQLGEPTGIYWFSYAYTEEMAREEANYAVNFADQYTINLPIFYDFEYDSIRYAEQQGVTVTADLVRRLTTAFCEQVKARHYTAGVYFNKDFLINYYGTEYLNNHPDYYRWYAQYGVATPDYEDYYIWQYSSTGAVDGISGNVDLNYIRGDSPFPPTPPTPTRRRKMPLYLYLRRF